MTEDSARRFSAVMTFATVTSLVWAVGASIIAFFAGLTGGFGKVEGSVLQSLSWALFASVTVLLITFFGGALLALLISIWSRTGNGRTISPWSAALLGFASGAVLYVMTWGLLFGFWEVLQYPEIAGICGLFGAVTGGSFVGISKRGALPSACDLPEIE